MRADPRLAALARVSGLRAAEIARFVEMDTIVVDDPVAMAAAARRLRRIRRLRRDLGLSVDAVLIVSRLLDRIEFLEKRLQAGAGSPPMR